MIGACLLMAALVACSNEDDEYALDGSSVGTVDSTTVATMRFLGSVTPFTADNSNTRASGDWEWKDGAVVFLQIYNGSMRIPGYAVYAQSTKTWTIPSWSGTIGASGKCEVYYFDGAGTSNKTNVTLDRSMGIYADQNASYVYNDGTVTVSASLKPLTSRIRFKREQNTSVSSINVKGITTYTAYNAATNTFANTDADFTAYIQSTGYTNYIYGHFTDANARELVITNNLDGAGFPFSHSFGSNVFQTGHSGFITIPTLSTNKGWSVTRTFTLTGNGKTVTFNMKYVPAGTFQMGAENAGSNAQPVHTVTLTKAYYMGVTEVTQALWYAIMGQKPTSDGPAWSDVNGLGDNNPANYISYEDCQAFISSLNTKLASQLTSGEQFNFPTEAQWEYAARGGGYSLGYTYAGGNNIDEVAWYTTNSGGMTHEVKGKNANELGLYDMSGNVWEWCLDGYSANYYSNSPTTDPVNTEFANGHVYRGGSFQSSAVGCYVAYRYYGLTAGHYSFLGLRLCLQ